MDLDQITEETMMDVLRKAQTAGIIGSTGIVGVDLTGLVSLIPVVTPFRNMLSRVGSTDGAKVATWRALLNINNQQPNPFVPYDQAGGLVSFDEQDVFALYQPMELVGRVTQDAMDIAKNYADAKSLTVLQTLNQLMIGEDKALIGAQNFALATPGTPTVATVTTGGSIPTATAVNVKVAARTGMNYYYGGSGIASAQGTGTTGAGATNSATASVAAVKGAVAYDWFVAGFYYTTTVTNTVSITSIPTANAAVPTNLPDLSSTAPAAVPTTDATGQTTQFNGLLATLAGDYGTGGLVTPGTGTGSGATFISADGSSLTLSGAAIAQIDTLLLGIWNSVKLSPTALMMNAAQASDISTLVAGSPGAVTFLQPNDIDGRSNIAAGGYVGSYLNKAAGGTRIRIEVHTDLPPGTIVARTDSVPFPGANIDKVLSVRTLRDYSSFDYAAFYNPGQASGGPRSETGVRCVETLVNRAPVAMGVLSNIGDSAGL